ncbi:GNAT family N-acetyltransferase [Clostridium botulinum]|nr:GNAT family N-acetyltransferase [Clostridium botulinum]NFS95623.1 GNAT family N-acetyltransferase [Clostridium botulinum]
MYIILDSDSKKWNEYLELLPQHLQDIYYTSNYYKLYERNGDGKAKLFIYREDEKIAINSFMLNEIKKYNLDEKYYDIESAYGYGGPLTNSHDETFLINFENEFLKYCNDNNIVAEFIRFHPIIKNQKIFKKNIEILHNRTTVYLDLTKGIEEIWQDDIKSKNRNMIRKAKKNGVNIQISNDYNEFKKIYSITMDKVSASNYYYFNDQYYDIVKKNDNYILLNATKNNTIIASAIFIQYGEYFHYHLAGSLHEYLKFSPNNLLLWEAIKLACNRGMKCFHFGGGLEDSLNDNLFKFKSSFSKNTTDFFIGKRIHNKPIYDYLISEWEKKNNRKTHMLLGYKI